MLANLHCVLISLGCYDLISTVTYRRGNGGPARLNDVSDVPQQISVWARNGDPCLHCALLSLPFCCCVSHDTLDAFLVSVQKVYT